MRATEREVGLAAVQAAIRLCQAVRAKVLQGEEPGKLDKQDRSPVTIADFGSQALVCRQIRQVFPHDPILAEEDSSALCRPENAAHLSAVATFVREQIGEASENAVRDWIDHGNGSPNQRYWVLDPIDGTKGFLRNEHYAIALALIEDGEVRWGFLACPALPLGRSVGAIFMARRGGGSEAYTLDGAPLGRVQVSDVTQPAQARIAESVESGHTDHSLSAEVKRTLGTRAESVRMDSQAKYASVAAGQAEIYLRAPNQRTPDYREQVWDHAAGWLVVKEAGGRISDVYGLPIDWSTGRRLERNIGLLATNGRLHDPVLEALVPLLP